MAVKEAEYPIDIGTVFDSALPDVLRAAGPILLVCFFIKYIAIRFF
jgi:hypothetical protein